MRKLLAKDIREFLFLDQILRSEIVDRLEKSTASKINKVDDIIYGKNNIRKDFELDFYLIDSLYHYAFRVNGSNNTQKPKKADRNFITSEKLFTFFEIEEAIMSLIEHSISHHLKNSSERIVENILDYMIENNVLDNILSGSNWIRGNVKYAIEHDARINLLLKINRFYLYKAGLKFAEKNFNKLDCEFLVNNYLDYFLSKEVHNFHPTYNKDEDPKDPETFKEKVKCYFLGGLRQYLLNQSTLKDNNVISNILYIDGEEMDLCDIFPSEEKTTKEYTTILIYLPIAIRMAKSVFNNCLDETEIAILRERVLNPTVSNKVIASKLGLSESTVTQKMPAGDSSNSRLKGKVLKFIKTNHPSDCSHFALPDLLVEFIIEELFPQLMHQQVEEEKKMALYDSTAKEK